MQSVLIGHGSFYWINLSFIEKGFVHYIHFTAEGKVEGEERIWQVCFTKPPQWGCEMRKQTDKRHVELSYEWQSHKNL